MSETATSLVLIERRGRIGQLTLNRPAGLNALNLEMVRVLHQQLEAWANDPQVDAVVLRGAGERAFCAGGDIRHMYDSYLAGRSHEPETFFSEEYDLDAYIHAYQKPILVLMDGIVLGGGMGLAQGASIRLLTERSRLGMPETAIGYFPDVGGSYFLSRLPGQLGIYLGVTGNHVGSSDALYAGLGDRCISSDRLSELEALIDSFNPADGSLRDQVAALTDNTLPEAELKSLQPAIDLHFAQPTIAAIRASLASEQRPEYRDWAQRTIEIIDNRSPLAMAVTLAMLLRGRTLPLADCFAMELHLGRQWFEKGNIMEGVRALIVDKDKQPRWQPAHIDQLDPAAIEAFFDGFQR
ncbi:MAG: enoyl-CoA hydratase/isomerase family protein [Pseudomonadaceae bacterium]